MMARRIETKVSIFQEWLPCLKQIPHTQALLLGCAIHSPGRHDSRFLRGWYWPPRNTVSALEPQAVLIFVFADLIPNFARLAISVALGGCIERSEDGVFVGMCTPSDLHSTTEPARQYKGHPLLRRRDLGPGRAIFTSLVERQVTSVSLRS